MRDLKQLRSTGDCNYDLVQKQHPRRSSPLGAKMGRGSPVCQQIREKIIEMFKNNVPQRKIRKRFGYFTFNSA